MAQTKRRTNHRAGAMKKKSKPTRSVAGFGAKAKQVAREALTGAAVGAVVGAIKGAADAVAPEAKKMQRKMSAKAAKGSPATKETA